MRVQGGNSLFEVGQAGSCVERGTPTFLPLEYRLLESESV